MKLIKSLLLVLAATTALQAQKLPNFKPQDQPIAPDYTKPENWNALPFRWDKADIIPQDETWISDSLKLVDVFYIYPTIYGKGKTWCADITNKRLNKRIDRLPVKFQATAFNRIARVYSPRYRQGIIKCFSDTTQNGNLALDFAYQDVKRAFEYYLKNYNNGRPIIIASHSQGTVHSQRLLKEYFDTPEMKKRLVCAYPIGFRMNPKEYELLLPCKDSTETNCYITWSSFRMNHTPDTSSKLIGKVCVNPLTWTLDSGMANGQGGILLGFNRNKPFKTQAKIHQNWLWVKTNTPFVKSWNNLHLMDYNLFWYNIRANVETRVKSYIRKKE
jgi:hypothetical protein